MKAAIEYAGARYRDFLDLQRKDQLDWATRRKPFAKGPQDGELRALIDRRLKTQEYWTRYSIRGVTDTVLPHAPLLYTYMSKERLREHLDKKGLRVSAGAQRTELNQIGEFPRGPYGTTIPPYSEEVGQNAAARSFYGIEYSLDAVPRPSDPKPPRPAISTEYFVVFAQTTGFSPKGRLSFQKMQAGFAVTFDHYALATPDLPVGSYLDYDIVAYGRNFMQKEIKGTLVARNNTGEQVAPVRNPATMQPIAVAGFNTVNTITLMRTGQ